MSDYKAPAIEPELLQDKYCQKFENSILGKTCCVSPRPVKPLANQQFARGFVCIERWNYIVIYTAIWVHKPLSIALTR